jgi:hypothetical protein
MFLAEQIQVREEKTFSSSLFQVFLIQGFLSNLICDFMNKMKPMGFDWVLLHGYPYNIKIS